MIPQLRLDTRSYPIILIPLTRSFTPVFHSCVHLSSRNPSWFYTFRIGICGIVTRMAIAVQTDQAYLDWNSSGVIVSRSFNISCKHLLIVRPPSLLGVCCLRYTLADLSLGHYYYPRGV